MLTADAVGTTFVSLNPAGASNSVYSARRAFLAAGPYEHHDVEHLAGVRRVAFRQHHLDDQEPAFGSIALRQWLRMVGTSRRPNRG